MRKTNRAKPKRPAKRPAKPAKPAKVETMKDEKENLGSVAYDPSNGLDVQRAIEAAMTKNDVKAHEFLVEYVRPGWDAIGREPEIFTDSATVMELLEALGRDLPRHRLNYLLNLGVITPEKRGGRLFWRAADIARLIVACDCRRYWIVGSPIWMENANPAEMARELVRQGREGTEKICALVDNLSVFDLCRYLAEVKTDEQRQQYLNLIFLSLERLGIVE